VRQNRRVALLQRRERHGEIPLDPCEKPLVAPLVRRARNLAHGLLNMQREQHFGIEGWSS
jgi:hypothetical protein